MKTIICTIFYETIIYVNDENYNIIYAFHPKSGIIYDYKKAKNAFDISKYQNFKKTIDVRFHYTGKNTIPDRIEVMYPKN